jgi:predicted TIM-barrel fold metal-dependent hydrolase
MADLDFLVFDADNHYYEAEDAFTRHVDRRMQARCMQWAEIKGRTRLLVGGQVNRFIPNPTFDPVARPGCLDQYYRGNNPDGASIKEAFGDLEPIRPEYRDREKRIVVMDEQRIEKTFMFPTLGVGMEAALKDDPEAILVAFRGFNRWLEEEWGFAYQNRMFAAPYFPMVDTDWLVAELEWALERDLRVICLQAAPAHGNRSPADPVFDPFWSLVNESGISVVCHGGDAGYNGFAKAWGEGGSGIESFGGSLLQSLVVGNKAPFDYMCALIAGRLFERFPNLRFASIEMGSNWVPYLLQTLDRSYGMSPSGFAEGPLDTFRRHIWVSPFHEEDVPKLKDLLGAENLLMGSDYPHAEGLAIPTDYVEELEGFTDAEVRLVMRENAMGLSERRPA